MKRNLKLGVERRKRLDTFDPLVDKQQKKVENVENIKFSYVSKLNFMFSTCSPIFCCLSAGGLEVSLHFFGNPGLLCGRQ